ncbi:hypothetical protein L195_g046456 [Trifolium pratense]|uniref:Uncharacterized protein n=1 Tax=Trifolium pratense TaxID=57577 RepID=A0A2K3MHR6_TRIPR|nr:hypothetical protein L195_g046456 [Trifolium pratense]
MTEAFTLLMFTGWPIRPRFRGHAAIILTLGTITSGLRIEGYANLGLLTENSANAGVLDFCKTRTSTESSSKFSSVFGKIIAASPVIGTPRHI